MRALVLGGTGFLGRHLVEALRARDHEITLFRRGLSSPGLFPGVEQLTGDRTTSLEALAGRRWDVVFDPSGYEPQHVRAAAQALKHDDVHYVYVSSISVYSDPSRASDETSPVHQLTGHEDGEVLNLDSYGRLKVACERAVDQVLPGQAQHIRAGLILGPHDYDERFAWWLRRLARGGDVLAPGSPDAPVQVIDVRDLAAWMVQTAEKRQRGVFNATGPTTPLALGDLLAATAATSGSSARLVWAPDALLQAHGVSPLGELPFWIPAVYADLFRTRIERALATGLRFRPFADTACDTWRWLQTGWDREASVRQHRSIRIPAGIDPEREARILAQVPR